MLDSPLDVMVVDEIAANRRFLRHMLQLIGVTRVREVAAGEEALAELRQQRGHVVLIVWNTPELNGLDLLRAIRGDETLKDLPVVIVSANAEQDAVLAAVRTGASHYLLFPFSAYNLEKTLNKVLSGSRGQRSTLDKT